MWKKMRHAATAKEEMRLHSGVHGKSNRRAGRQKWRWRWAMKKIPKGADNTVMSFCDHIAVEKPVDPVAKEFCKRVKKDAELKTALLDMEDDACSCCDC
jgi:hypothetical protein